ncbi:MAG: hypothetical protein ABII24_03025 [bacterium]
MEGSGGAKKKIVFVIGTGTIGEPLIGLLCDFAKQLGFDEVWFNKRTPLTDEIEKVRGLIERGGKLCTAPETIPAFEAQGFTVTATTEEAVADASVVIDCTAKSGLEHKKTLFSRYDDGSRLFVAQGSEHGFGKCYVRGANDSALVHGEDRFVQVMSCNTHNIVVLLKAVARAFEDPDNLVSGRFMMMRRANDASQDGKFIPAPQAGKHDDPKWGTHHARDAVAVCQTLGFEPDIFSSAAKFNTQYMHMIWWDLVLREEIGSDEAMRRLTDERRICLTEKISANKIFSFGRDHGHYGRILSQTVIPEVSVTVLPNGHEVIGQAFTPQDGNALLSSAAITAWFLDPEGYNERLDCLRPLMFQRL